MIRKRMLTSFQMDAVSQALARISAMPIVIDDRSRTLAQIATACRIHKRKSGIRFAIVDYLGLIEPERGSKANREQQVAQVSRGLKNIATDLDITVICLCQLNREVEKRNGTDKRPKLSDLRESGAIKQDGDLILLLDMPWLHDDKATPNVSRLQIAKQRNGALGQISLDWNPLTTAYRPMPVQEPFTSDYFGEAS